MDCKPETLHRDDDGASMVEYALLLVLIAMVAILGIQIAGQEVSNAFSTVAGGFSTN
jgi:pilus assembly protein Flp/PilA